MKSAASEWRIAGQGLAGTCLAWQLWLRGAAFRIADDGLPGSSMVAAGLINPITGKNFEPSHGLSAHLPEAISFYQEIGHRIGRRIWHPMPILRLASNPAEWDKMRSKLGRADVVPWVADPNPELPPGDWAGAVELRGGGRLDTVEFLQGSGEFFLNHGIRRHGRAEEEAQSPTAWCEGSAALIDGRRGPHRCAKGEILTVVAEGWDETRIRVGAGGWLVPLGNHRFKVGSTYDWDRLDSLPTTDGRARVESLARRLMNDRFEVVAHEAGIRPILRRSDPLLAKIGESDVLLNGLGSKGSLYAPGCARRLADWMLDGIEPEDEYLYRSFPDPTES